MLKLKGGTRPPWVGLGVSVWVQIAVGVSYTFPLYSPSFKSVLGFNQSQVTLLGVANDVGENVGLLPGIASNKLPPWLMLAIGSLCTFIGFGLLWLSITETLSLPFFLLWIALVIATNSCAWLTTAVLVTNMRNFPATRGTVAGILKGYGGIAAAIFTEIYRVVLKNSPSNFLLFLAIGIPVLCFAVMFFVRPCTPASAENSTEKGHFLFIQCSSVLLAVYLLARTILDNTLPVNDTVSYVFVAVMVLILMAPITIPIKMTLYPRKAIDSESEISEQKVEHSEGLVQEGEEENTKPLLHSSSANTLESYYETDGSSEMAMLLAEGEGAVVPARRRRPRRGEDFTFTEALVKADFWLLFFVYFVGIGTGITVVNNLAQIGTAQGVEDTTILLSLFSFFNFVGRLGGGVVSEYFVTRKTIPRTFWMTCTQITMIIIYLLFAYAIKGTLYPAIAFLGICFGAQFSILIPTVSELFGLKHFGLFFNFMCLGNPLGALLFSFLLAGRVYDNEVARQLALGLIDSGVSCVGADCFKLTFFVLAGVSAAGAICSIILTLRIRPVYQMLYAGGSFKLPQTSGH